jgi:CHAP domain
MRTLFPDTIYRFFFAVTFFAFFAIGGFRNAVAQVASNPGCQLVARLDLMLSRMKDTAYEHTTAINEETGSLKCDCSGLVGYVLRDQFPEAYLSLRGKEASWRGRPLAVTFYETFTAAEAKKSNGRWHHVAKLMDVKPGDILAWRKDELKKGRTTGHVAVVSGVPMLEKDGRVRLRVIDSTNNPHSNDTRPAKTSGVGSGDIYFTMDQEGRPSGFYVRNGILSQQALAFARLVDLGNAASSVFDEPTDTDFIGLDLAAAHALASKQKLESRVIAQDGKVISISARFRHQRVNFVLRTGKVIRALRG